MRRPIFNLLGVDIVDMDDIGPDSFAILPDGKVTCLICTKTLSNFTSARRHYKTSHQPTEASKCSVCEKTYKNTQTMKAHMKRDHKISQKMLKAGVFVEPNVIISTQEDEKD